MTDETITALDRDRKTRPPWLLIAGVMLLLAAGAIGLWAWLGPDDDDGPDYVADCQMIENEAPEFGDEIALLMNPTAPHQDRVGAANDAADQFTTIADQLTDRQFANQMAAAANAMRQTGDALEIRDLSVMTAEMKQLAPFYGQFYNFLDQHCERWLGPGQWGQPGTTPTGPTEIPTSLPSMPTGEPRMPTMPPVPSHPPVPKTPPPPRQQPADKDAIPAPYPNAVQVGQRFTAVVAKNARRWIQLRITVRAIEEYPRGRFHHFHLRGHKVVLVRWKATNISHRALRFPEDPVWGSFTLSSFVQPVGVLPVQFAPYERYAPAHCTVAVDPIIWKPGQTRRGCQVGLLYPGDGIEQVTYQSGPLHQQDDVIIDY
jgi:cell division septation protein DedD